MAYQRTGRVLVAGVLGILLAALGAVWRLPVSVADVVASGTSDARVTFNTNGTFTGSNSGGVTESASWVLPASLAPGSYTIRCHVNSGTLSTGTVDSDLALSSARTFICTRATAGTTAANITLTLKNNGVTVKTTTIDLSAQTLI